MERAWISSEQPSICCETSALGHKRLHRQVGAMLSYILRAISFIVWFAAASAYFALHGRYRLTLSPEEVLALQQAVLEPEPARS